MMFNVFNDDHKRDISPSPSITSEGGDILCRSLKIEHLTRNVSAEHLEDIFGTWGKLSHVEVARDKAVKLSLGHGTIRYKRRTDTEQAFKLMNGGQIDGKRIVLTFQQILPSNMRSELFVEYQAKQEKKKLEKEKEIENVNEDVINEEIKDKNNEKLESKEIPKKFHFYFEMKLHGISLSKIFCSLFFKK